MISALVLALGLAPALLAGQAPPRPCDAFCLSQRARAALAAGQHADFLYAVASGFALLGQHDSALAWLDHLAQIGASRAPTATP